MKLSQQGFTLIELMVALLIVSAIFGVVISATAGLNRRGRDTTRINDIHNIQSAIQVYYADNQSYPEAMPTLTTGGAFSAAGKVYLSKTPTDPGGALPYCYIAQVSQNTPGVCSNIINSTNKCQYYQLCAQLENSQVGSTPCVCGGNNYNFSVTSP